MAIPTTTPVADTERLGKKPPEAYAPKPQLAIFGITSSIQYPVHEYKQTVLNKTIKNDIAGCVLNTSTGNVTLPAGSYIVNAFATFGGSKSEVDVGVYVKNPLFTEAVKNRSSIGYASDPSSIDKTINVTTLFTITEPATIFMGARTSLVLDLVANDYYTHLEIMKVG